MTATSGLHDVSTPRNTRPIEAPRSPGRNPDSLTPSMLESLLDYGAIESIDRGTTLFEQGSRLLDLFVVIEGKLELYEQKGKSARVLDATLIRRQFTGELDLLDGRPSLLSCRATKTSRILRICRGRIQSLMRTELDIAEVILTKWISRRANLVDRRKGGIIVIGDGCAAETMRVERFLTGNGYPHQLIDSTLNPDAEVLLLALNVSEDQLPVVFFADGLALHKPENTELAAKLGFAIATSIAISKASAVGAPHSQNSLTEITILTPAAAGVNNPTTSNSAATPESARRICPPGNRHSRP
jgi:CRP-like cAMP-binding protein